MQSLRRYLTNSELIDRTGVASVDSLVLVQSEQDIDNILASFYQGNYSPYYIGKTNFSSITLTTTTATLNNTTATNGYFAYTTLEILSGSFAGNKYAVKNNTNNVLEFFDTNTGLTGEVIGRIYQSGKAPFNCDCETINDTIYKTINEKIKQAVAFQYEFRLKNSKNFDTLNPVSSYSVDGADLRETYDTKNTISIEQRISPQAIDILGGLTNQTI